MKFICDGLTLSDAVVKASKACAVRTTMPVMECIKLSAGNDVVTLLATDGELTIRNQISAEVFKEGEICVPGKLFADFIGKLTDCELTLETVEGGMEIRYADSGTRIQTMSAEAFPKINLDISENSFVIDKKAFKRGVAKTVFCCAQDDSRPILKGCLLEWKDKLEMTALDGYRLALASEEIVSKTGEMNIICPARTLNEIARSLSDDEEKLTIYTEGGMMRAETEGKTILSRLYQGDFIRKESVISKMFETRVILSREELIKSVQRAAILIRGDKNNLITITLTGDGMNVSSVSEAGNVSESFTVEHTGRDLTISMNAKYLLDALGALEEERVEIDLNGPYSPFIVQNEREKDSLYLILPVRNA